MMGVGKTTFGKKLAYRVGIDFFDSDQEIEKDIGHSVSWIFENAGEDEFRKLETSKINEILNRDSSVVLALGGGAFIAEQNRKTIKDKAFSIWLNAKPETILNRVSHRKDRPLLEGVDNKLQKIKDLCQERGELYKLADVEVLTEGKPNRNIVSDLAIASQNSILEIVKKDL